VLEKAALDVAVPVANRKQRKRRSVWSGLAEPEWRRSEQLSATEEAVHDDGVQEGVCLPPKGTTASSVEKADRVLHAGSVKSGHAPARPVDKSQPESSY